MYDTLTCEFNPLRHPSTHTKEQLARKKEKKKLIRRKLIAFFFWTVPVASSLLGAIAAVMAAVIWTIIAFGARLRARSKIAVSLQQQEGEVLSDVDHDEHDGRRRSMSSVQV